MDPSVRLRTASRTRPRSRPHLIWTAANAFADRLLARYTRRGAALGTLDLLLSMRYPLFVHQVLQRCAVEITAPSLVLLARERQRQRPLGAPRDWERRSSAAISARRWERQAHERARVSSAVLHLVQRSVRLDAPVPQPASPREPTLPGVAAGPSGDQGAGAMPVVSRSMESPSRRTLLQQSLAREGDRTIDQALQSDPEAQARPPAGAHPRRAGTEVDLEQLADRVISSIDRRIVAQRERLGRN